MAATAYNTMLITKLSEMRDVEKANKQTFKVKAYDTVIKQIQAYTKPINSIDDVTNAGFKGIGKGIMGKIEQLFNTGVIKQVEEKRALMEAVNILTTVHGIGPTKAKELVVDHNITTIEQLTERTDLLNEVQVKGLMYHADMQKRIPRKEMDKHLAMLKSHIDTGSPFEIAGSYRRGASDSGDIDVIIRGETGGADDIIKKLQSCKYIVEVLAHGETKFMGICKLPRYKTFRRIDIMVADPVRYAFALLYFTGSKEYNVYVRNVALSKGYSLNEYGFTMAKLNKTAKAKDACIPVHKTEREILAFLGLEYIEPTKR